MPSSLANLTGCGFAPNQAIQVSGTVTTALTATGTNQATALVIPANICQFTTVASGTGAILSATANVTDDYLIYNGGANALLVYPPVGSNINTGAANAGFSVPVGKSCWFLVTSPTFVIANLSA